MDLLNIMVLLSIKNQAGPAQDPRFPKPKPSRSGPGPLANQAGPAQDPCHASVVIYVMFQG